jgi:hypothetical protein
VQVAVAQFGLARAHRYRAAAQPDLLRAVHDGVLVGLAIVAMSFAINYTFAQRSLKLWLIDGGYHTLQFVLYGLILGLWH